MAVQYVNDSSCIVLAVYDEDVVPVCYGDGFEGQQTFSFTFKHNNPDDPYDCVDGYRSFFLSFVCDAEKEYEVAQMDVFEGGCETQLSILTKYACAIANSLARSAAEHEGFGNLADYNNWSDPQETKDTNKYTLNWDDLFDLLVLFTCGCLLLCISMLIWACYGRSRCCRRRKSQWQKIEVINDGMDQLELEDEQLIDHEL